MKLAINYSAPAASLFQSGELVVDYFKTPDWDWMVDEALKLRPVAVHFNLEAGNSQIEQVQWDELDRLARITQTPFINLHLDPKQKHHRKIPIDSHKKSDKRKLIDVMLSDVMFFVDHYGADRVIVENSPYRGESGNTLRLGVEPDVINTVIEEADCGFLIDISHAIIASHYIGMDSYEYFSRLPTRKIKEMHFAGIHKIRGVWIDHLSILKKNLSWLDWSLDQIQSGEWSLPWLLAFEYGGYGKQFDWRSDPEVIKSQVPLLYERIKNLD